MQSLIFPFHTSCPSWFSQVVSACCGASFVLDKQGPSSSLFIPISFEAVLFDPFPQTRSNLGPYPKTSLFLHSSSFLSSPLFLGALCPVGRRPEKYPVEVIDLCEESPKRRVADPRYLLAAPRSSVRLGRNYITSPDLPSDKRFLKTKKGLKGH